MLLGWMGWTVVAGILLAVGAVAAEAWLRGRGLPGRHVWAVALVLTAAAPIVSVLRPSRVPALPPLSLAVTPSPVTTAPALSGPTVSAAFHAADPWVSGLWLAASGVLALLLIAGLGRLSARARRWPRIRLDDQEVLLSHAFGPAVLGVRRIQVVLPRWTLALAREHLRLVVLHEEEHRRSGDVRLLQAGAVAAVLMPWNPALWWQLRRLRAAVELDCDARVLRRGAPPRTYGALLLELGRRSSGPSFPFPVAALSNPSTLLERRLHMIVRGANRTGRRALVGSVAVTALALAVACEAPSPTAAGPSGVTESARSSFTAREVESPTAGTLTEIVTDGTGESPLVYVDGVRLEGGVPPDADRIARVEVVKGAAAEKLFGPDAAHGVIQIFTKDAAGAEDAPAGETGTGGVVRFEAAPTQPGTAAGTLSKVQVLVDGQPFEGALSSIPKESIERVDVVKGPEGRVIQVTTKKAANGGGEEV